ncbi:DUF2339 domain-containing protein [Pseudohoeflea suaedae]|uniref:DUF2339 domain-containing protein n=1 Tax=Pseudohoeflea suaedae TaxID=877384 RepID=A0A4R5PJN8_9HYPH|nr:DUF2339 domain-containing protein [Pseudohoeflea suaedae]TDH35890.1 DUF2339 domain-containing protein [Pseudohoeflea suaedae]
MDIIGLFILGVVFLALFGFLSLKKRVRALERDLQAVEERLAQLGISGMQPAPEADPHSELSEAAAARTQSDKASASEPEVAAAVPPPLPPAQAAQDTEARGGFDLESAIGGRWSVLLGGVAIALGSLFLVRYSIEAGLLGPGARVTGGICLSIGLFAGGEWLRRRDTRENLPSFTSADIPGILTGAGAVAAFGTTYAAHALYGFIGAGIAFPLLTLIGLASLLLASVHGPKLAAIGLLGAYGAPLLVHSSTPNMLAMTLHVLAVTASVMSVGRIRQWKWVLIGGAVGSLGWTAALIGVIPYTDEWFVAFHVIAVAIVLVIGFGWGQERPAETVGQPTNHVAITSLAVLALIAGVYEFSLEAPANSAIALATGGILVLSAFRFAGMAPLAPWAAVPTTFLAGALYLGRIDDPAIFDDLANGTPPIPPDIPAFLTACLVPLVPVALVALWTSWRTGRHAPRTSGYLAISFALVALLGLIAIYLRISDWETSFGTGFAALVLAVVCVGLTEQFGKLRPGDWKAPAPAVFAVTAIAALALAMGVVTTKLWLPLGMALTSAGVAWVHRSRPFAALPVVAVVLSVLAFSGLFFNIPFDGETIGTTPFLNKLILIAGLPAAALLLGGKWMRRSGAGLWASLQTAVGLALLALFVALELRHFITGGAIGSPSFGLADMAVQSIAALGFAIGLQFLARRNAGAVYDVAALVAGALGVAMLLFGLGLAFNPLLSSENVGEGRVFNLLMPAYLVTGLMAAVVTRLSTGVRPRWYRIGYGATAGILLFLYASLMVRHGFQGGRLGILRSSSDAEVWTYSIVWLMLGGALLAAGLRTRSLPMRIASAAVILLTVAKVFIIDMSALTGALRAFSFIGLGLALVAIGRFYQRILLRGRNDGAPRKPPELPVPGSEEPRPDGG